MSGRGLADRVFAVAREEAEVIPRVLLDVDGVLADFHTPCLALINEYGGTNHKLEDFDDWNIFDALKTPPEVKSRVYKTMKRTGWCSNIGIYPGAKEGVELLLQHTNLYIVTSPMDGPTWTSERDSWLKRHFDIDSEHVIHTSAKYVCAGDMLIDDKISRTGRHTTSVDWPSDGLRVTRRSIRTAEDQRLIGGMTSTGWWKTSGMERGEPIVSDPDYMSMIATVADSLFQEESLGQRILTQWAVVELEASKMGYDILHDDLDREHQLRVNSRQLISILYEGTHFTPADDCIQLRAKNKTDSTLS